LLNGEGDFWVTMPRLGQYIAPQPGRMLLLGAHLLQRLRTTGAQVFFRVAVLYKYTAPLVRLPCPGRGTISYKKQKLHSLSQSQCPGRGSIFV
jgi:hypothetical protein